MTDSTEAGINNLPNTPNHKPTTGNKDEYYHATKTMRLFMSKQVIGGLTDNTLMREMMRDFYDQNKITEFTEIQAAAAEAYSKQLIETGEKTGHHDLFEKAFSSAKIEFSCLIKVAKVVFKKDQGRCDSLRLFQKKQGKIGEILEYMDNFYKALLIDPEAIAALSRYGYSEQVILESREKFIKANSAYSIYQNENDEAVESTRVSDEKLAELDEWMYDFYALLKVAKIKRPDLMTPAN